MNVIYNLGIANMVANSLSKYSRVSVAHVRNEKKTLAKDMHWLSYLRACLLDADNRGLIVQNSLELSLLVKLNKK